MAQCKHVGKPALDIFGGPIAPGSGCICKCGNIPQVDAAGNYAPHEKGVPLWLINCNRAKWCPKDGPLAPYKGANLEPVPAEHRGYAAPLLASLGLPLA